MLGLKGEDQKAVDWIMQSRTDAGSNDQTAWALAATEIDDRRLKGVGRLLDVLGEWPTYDPPENLTTRTLGKIEAHRALPVALPPAIASAAGPAEA
jgi:hypothetical protein